MLDTATKRRIDTARDILVGKVPDPKSQVEQITIALIYKFMDDMDAEAEELGGRRSFFAGEFAKYGWAKLMRSGLGGHETLGLYAEAITRMPENPGVPPLFRDIFKNAFLPYRDPETLRAFLKIIDEFEYDHSERLGDAFEYLLSVLGSQGDAGQFRTPRHIIDFIVDIVDPKKGDTILDPACGTAGFLISAWKHILDANCEAQGESTLTPDERERLAAGIRGYDISPDMVRLSLANMYLHGFADPHIVEYDTLTSDERWNEFADVILANPPFMSPKGGIKPHNRFGVQSNRSEVLFVDYMAEHLTPNGRAGIIVPEGVIFQSGKSYKALRKMLVEKYLVAVVSLPAGVFNPYSGVKTSILILDRPGARASDTIGFFKVTNDGFALGAQRRETDGSELAEILEEIAEYRMDSSEEVWGGRLGRAVRKAEIAATGDYNLSGERYRTGATRYSHYPSVSLGTVVEILDSRRRPITKSDRKPGPFPYYGATGVLDWVEDYLFDEPLVLVGEDGAKWGSGEKTAFPISGKAWVNNHAHVLRPMRDRLLDSFLIEMLIQQDLSPFITGVTVPKLNQEKLRNIEIPLPPLEVQRTIVAEVEGYRKVIGGARTVVENYRPHVPIDSAWDMKPIGEICDLVNGTAFKPSDWSPAEKGGLPIVRIQNLNNRHAPFNYFEGEVRDRFLIEPGQLLFSWSGSRGTSFGAHIWRGGKAILNQHIFKVLFDKQEAIKEYLHYALNEAVVAVEENLHGGVGLVHITKGNLEKIEIPLPPIETQRKIVAELEAERALVEANREMIARMEKKIEAAIARIWGAAELAGLEQLAAE